MQNVVIRYPKPWPWPAIKTLAESGMVCAVVCLLAVLYMSM